METEMMSGEIDQLAASLAAAQSEFETIRATRTGQTGHRQYRYADLADHLEMALKVLPKHGLAIVQRPIDTDGTKVTIETILAHKSGQFIGGRLSLAIANATPQGVGSTITYLRRYSLGAMLGIAVEEDDDGKAGGKPARPAGAVIDTTPRVNVVTKNRIIHACESLSWPPEKLAEILKGQKLADMSQKDAEGLAAALEKKFRDQQVKATF